MDENIEKIKIEQLAATRMLTKAIQELTYSVNNLTLEQYPAKQIPNIIESRLPMHLRKQM